MSWQGTILSEEQRNRISEATKLAMQRKEIKDKQSQGLANAWANPNSKFRTQEVMQKRKDALKIRRENGEVFGASGWKHSEEAKKNISINQKKAYAEGRKRKIRMTGEDNPFYNKRHTKETREKMSGSNNPSWKGGITNKNRLLRAKVELKDWRRKIFERDNYTCQNKDCGYCNNKKGGTLHAHHIKTICLYPELIYDINNGITYCKDFHMKSGLHKDTYRRKK